MARVVIIAKARELLLILHSKNSLLLETYFVFEQIVVDSCRPLYTSIVIRIASTTNLKFSTFLSKTVSSFQLSERNVISNLGWSLPRIAIFSLLTNNSNFVVMLFGKHRESSFPEEQCSHVCDYYEVYIFVCNTTASQICNHSACWLCARPISKSSKEILRKAIIEMRGKPRDIYCKLSATSSLLISLSLNAEYRIVYFFK